MKKLTKITFTVTTDEAETLRKAIGFFHIGCTKATADYPEGINEQNLENMALFEVTPEQLQKLNSFGEWLTEELADLEAWNAEVDHFENLTTSNQ